MLSEIINAVPQNSFYSQAVAHLDEMLFVIDCWIHAVCSPEITVFNSKKKKTTKLIKLILLIESQCPLKYWESAYKVQCSVILVIVIATRKQE